MSRFSNEQAARGFFPPSFSGNRIKDESFVAVGVGQSNFLSHRDYGDEATLQPSRSSRELAKSDSCFKRPRFYAAAPFPL
ncbi:MAG: hypothetical protein Q8M02_11405 [Candidatus Didemnitutus sp.]|nr:hypothetical protein [Candidatus Didemnitutus sp.]